MNRYKSKKKAFTKYTKKYTEGKGITEQLEHLKKHSIVIRVLVHTQISKIGFGQKKAHMMEIQVAFLAFFLCCERLCIQLTQSRDSRHIAASHAVYSCLLCDRSKMSNVAHSIMGGMLYLSLLGLQISH